MKKIIGLLGLFLMLYSLAFSQSDCQSAVIVRGNTLTYNPNGIGNKLEQLACGGVEHNSIWIAFQAKASGKLNFTIRAYTLAGLPTTADFDWSVFQLAGAPGSGVCDSKTQLSCNYSGGGTAFGIPGATGLASPNYSAAAFNPGLDVTNGTWYAIIIDQFSSTTPLLFSLQFTGNPEYDGLNSTPAIFDNRTDFTISTGSDCSGTYAFTNTSVAASGIASYLWDFGDGTTSTSANPVIKYTAPGTYYVTLTITDNNGYKTLNRRQIVYNNAPPVLNAGGILLLPACTDANNGSITITTTGAPTPGVTGGIAPYTFELVSPSATTRPAQTSGSFSNLPAGGYTIKVTDACGKAAILTATVTQVTTNSTITWAVQNVQPSCNTTPTGTATLSASGTKPPYTMALVNSSPVLVAAQTALQRDPITATYYCTFNNLLPGIYTVDVTDGCGKIRRATFTVTSSTAPNVGAVVSASCSGDATGTINVTATAATGLTLSGSPGTFQYALIQPSPVTRPFQAGSVFENLPPGIYTVAVQDVCGNIGTAATTIGKAVNPTFGTAFTTLSCPNSSTGTIEAQVSAVGGGSPLTFALVAPSPVIRAPQAGNTFSNLPPGTYTIRLTDVCGRQVSSTATVAAATAPSFTTTLTASCSGSASGTITVSPATSSVGPYGFELISPGAAIRPLQPSNVANTTSSIFTGLGQNNYTVRITDGCGVPATAFVTVPSPTVLVFPTGSTSIPSCAASATGQITVAQPTTGIPAYKYELIAPSPVIRAPQYSRIFNGILPGDYTIRITDSCGTQVTISSPLTVAAATAPGLSVTNTNSCATASGTITCLPASANQGGGLYTFDLISPSPVVRATQTSTIFTGLPVGTYTVQITDGCGIKGTATTTIAAAGAFSPTASGTVLSCNGSSYNAQIIVTTPQNFTTGGPIPAGSGGGPYTFALYNATNTTMLAGPQSSSSFTTVVPATGTPTHTVRVTDVCGTTSTITVTINPPPALTTPVITATTPSCTASATGVVRVTTAATGGLAPYTYTLLNASDAAVVAGPQTGVVFNVMAASSTGYLIRATDACGNVVTSSTPLNFVAAVAPTVTAVATASCASASSGRIEVTPGTGANLAGGTFSYALYNTSSVLIRPLQASPLFTSIAAGDYEVRITDKCGTTGSTTINVPNTVTTLTASGIATGSCTGGTSGTIKASGTGGSLPISFSILNQATSAVVAGPQSDSIFSGLSAGTYLVQATDACGTVQNSSAIVVGNLTGTPTITTSAALDCSGIATVAGYAAGGNGGPYTYAICSGATCTGFGSFSTNSTFIVNVSGTYRIAAKDRCGNQIESSDIVISIPAKAVITGVTNAQSCGATTITVTTSNTPNSPYYSLDGSNFASSTGIIAPGAHTIRVANYNAGAFGCASDVYNFSVTPIGLGIHQDQSTQTVSAGISTFQAQADQCRSIASLTTTNAAGQVSGNVTAKVWVENAQPTQNGAVYVRRHYEITPASGPVAAAQVTLYFTQQEFTEFNTSNNSASSLPANPNDNTGKNNLRVFKYAGTSNNGSGLPNSYPVGTPQIIAPGASNVNWNNTLSRWEVTVPVTSFSGFVVSGSLSILPLQWLSASTRLQGNSGIVNWSTADEKDVAYFTVERSTDGIWFTDAGTVLPQNQGSNHYTFTNADVALLPVSVIYYRIRQTSKDGSKSYSKILVLLLKGSKATVLLYPNPVQNELNLAIGLPAAQRLQLRITDVQGRFISQHQVQVAAGSSNLQIPATTLPQGMYQLHITGNDIQKVVPFVK